MYVVSLVLVYAVLMSVWWVLMKKLTTKGVPNNLIRFASGMGAGLLFTWSFLQHGGMSYLTGLSERFWWSLAGTVVLNVILAYLYVKAIEKSVASMAVHVTLFSPVIAIFTSSYIFGIERIPGTLTLAGIGAVLAGLYVLHFNPYKFGWNPAGPFVEIWHNRGKWLWYTIGIAVCGGLSIPLDKNCVVLSDYGIAPGLTLFISWGVVYGLIGVRSGDFIRLRALAEGRPIRLLVLLSIVFGIAVGFQAHAYNYQHASAVASLKRLDAPFTVLLSWMVFPVQESKEGSLVFRVLGSVVAFAGAILIGLSKFVA